MARPRRGAVLIGALGPLTLTACSAGQVTQTATQERDHTGGSARIGELTIRGVALTYPRDGVHDPGDPVPLTMAIVNGGRVQDELLEVSGEFFTGAVVESGDGDSGIPVPAGTKVVVDGEAATVTLTGLAEPKTTARSVELTLTFARAGETTVRAITSPAPELRPRAPAFDFHGEEPGEQSELEETAP